MKTHIAAEYAAPGLVISTYIKIRVICERAIPNSNGRLQPLWAMKAATMVPSSAFIVTN